MMDKFNVRRLLITSALCLSSMFILGACQRGPTVPSNNGLESSAIPSTGDVSITSERKMEATSTQLNHENSRSTLTITVLYDNNPFDERLKTAWGFAALIEYQGHTLLFDTGGDGPTLLGNMSILKMDPTCIQSIVLSHAHGDHTGGLGAVLESSTKPTVYLPPSFSASFKHKLRETTSVIEVTPDQILAEGIFTTGEMGGSIPEQSLVIQTDRGLVIITGCAHPGIEKIVKQARESFDEPVHLVMGGFHLGSRNETEIDAILTEFRRLGVERVAPCHCTGDLAQAMFAAEYGEDYIQAGVGRIIKVDSANP
jgi:7,8-dihydropterin-6-yl-methyl-4-(beta-D-ribofuranosyl)aminobenzene 5'-phosphate synthase